MIATKPRPRINIMTSAHIQKFRDRNQPNLSHRLPENTLRDISGSYHESKTGLAEYTWVSGSEQFLKTNPKMRKNDFIKPGDPNIGWKIHLNVLPRYVKIVSEYLKQNGYAHKYLSGGEQDVGKVFTVYIGSHELIQKLSKEISKDLIQYLSKPVAQNGDIEFAPGVVARFVAGRGEYNHYGQLGFPLLNSDWTTIANMRFMKKTDEEEIKQFEEEANARAFETLRKKFGRYFY